MALTQIDHDQYGGHVRVSFTSLSNTSGASRSAGDVVAQDTATANSFTTTTTQGDMRAVFVVVDSSIASTAAGYVAGYGIATVNVQGNVALGRYLRTSTTAGRAEDAGADVVAGVFGRALTAFTGSSGTVTALLFGVTLSMPAVLETGTWSDVTANRADNTVYQNTSGRKRRVQFRASGTAININLAVGSANPPGFTVAVFRDNSAVIQDGWCYTEVPNNWYYRMILNGATLGAFYELDE